MSGDTIALHDGTILTNVHTKGNCTFGTCCIHNPSEHPLNTAPLSWMQELLCMFRVCEHGIQHPDPDDIAFNMGMGRFHLVEAITSVHLVEENCDGCCQRKSIRTSSTGDES